MAEMEEGGEPGDLSLVPAQNPLVSMSVQNAGLMAMGAWSDQEFAHVVKTVKSGLQRLDTIINEVLERGVDYDEPAWMKPDENGRKKKNLLLPGAEKLCFMLKLIAGYGVTRTVGEAGEPAVHYGVQCLLHLGSLDGPVVATGVGSANSHETKYRYRMSERVCPECGKDTLRKSKFPDKKTGDKGFYCHAKAGGCGAQFVSTDERITNQVAGSVENPDPMDLDNTLLKMAKTRALRDAVKSATAGSGRLTQDLEDFTPSNVSVESRAEVVEDAEAQRAVRAEEEGTRLLLISEIWTSARRANLKKVGEVLKEIANGLRIDVPRRLADLTTEQMKKASEHLGALAQIAEENADESQRTQA